MLYSIALVSAIRFVCVGLCCSSLGDVGLFSVTVCGLLPAAASHGAQAPGRAGSVAVVPGSGALA